MRVVLIGAGNVGYHLGLKLHEVGLNIVQVFSRKRHKASRLARKINATTTTQLKRINPSADLYIIAVHDDAIFTVGQVLNSLACREKLIVHTSGSTSKNILSKAGLKRYGIFYPLQTFSIKRVPDFNTIPFCVDANLDADSKLLAELAAKITLDVHRLSDEQRAIVHVAAVYVNNFANHLFHQASEILKKGDMDMNILIPLIEETVGKIKENKPVEMQTGPAVRSDNATIKRHLKLLKDHRIDASIYRLLTKSIQATHLKED